MKQIYVKFHTDMRKILFISPHLDDVLLSCGAHIIEKVKAGLEVLIVTVFTTSGNDKELLSHYKKRKSDDYKAVGVLGARALHWDFPDAPFRNQEYRDFSTILFHHQLPKSEKAIVDTLAKRLQNLIDESCPIEVWFPLGVGGHIDHHLVFESSHSLSKSSARFHYYEDLPYALLKGWHAVRWQQLSGLPVSPSHLEEEFKRISLVDTPFPFVHNYFASIRDKQSSIHKYESEFEKLRPGMWDAAIWKLKENSYRVHSPIFPQEVLEKKCDAIGYYQTEWPVLFGPEKENIQQYLKISENDPRCIERYWERF